MKTPQPGIRKYVVGLSLIGLFVAGLVVWLLIQATAVKADNQTYSTATKLGQKLETYISKNNKIPASLGSVSKESVPSTIEYTKVSDQRYKFCITYKTTSSSFDPSQVQTSLMGAALGGGFSGSYPGYPEDIEPSYLYIPASHKKGENCQTIKPYIFTNSSDPYKYDPGTKTMPACAYDQAGGQAAAEEYLLCMQNNAGAIQSDGAGTELY